MSEQPAEQVWTDDEVRRLAREVTNTVSHAPFASDKPIYDALMTIRDDLMQQLDALRREARIWVPVPSDIPTEIAQTIDESLSIMSAVTRPEHIKETFARIGAVRQWIRQQAALRRQVQERWEPVSDDEINRMIESSDQTEYMECRLCRRVTSEGGQDE